MTPLAGGYAGYCSVAVLAFALWIAVMQTNAVAFDAKRAQESFKKCNACHQLGPDAKNRIGPQLNGIDGRTIGSVEEFKYSRTMREAGSEGKFWDRAKLLEFLEAPRRYFKGTRMSFVGLKDEAERENLVDWLISISQLGNAPAVGDAAKPLLGAKAAALEGDPEYGQYLSGECVTCHKPGGVEDGIPSITGWPKEEFIDVLYQYKNELRENPVMRTVTKRLGDEEMAALAAYFGAQERN